VTTAAITGNGVYVVHPSFGDAKANPVIEHVHLKQERTATSKAWLLLASFPVGSS
jgi:hypothetical protein